MCWLLPATQLWRCPHILLLALALVALVECFLGYRAWRLLLGINGAVLGLAAGIVLGLVLQSPILVPLAALAGMAGGAILFSQVEPLGMFIFALATGASLAFLVAQATALPFELVLPVSVAAGASTALLCGACGRGATVALTAIAGAQQISSIAAAYLWSLQYDGALLRIATARDIAIFLVLAALGLTVQTLTLGPRPQPQP